MPLDPELCIGGQVCAGYVSLRNRVAELESAALCGCGDQFNEDLPGLCPSCLMVHDLDLDRHKEAAKEMVEAYGEMEKGIEDPILCHYNGLRLHNAMEDLRALVIPGYEPSYEPKPECLIENGTETPAGESFFNPK